MICDGVINIYKEKGYTSHDVVAIIKKQLSIKAGHTGTLDPDACGVLPICIGKATKLADYITAGTKGYRAVIRLGVTTDTQDMTGTVLKEKPVNLTADEIQDVIMSFIGEISQIPPMYSAIKVNGEKLYNLARKGIEIERKSRMITIYKIDILNIGQNTAEIDVICSKGTYIRTLCNDIGEKLNVGGAMESLLRTKSSNFSIENAIKIEELLALRDESRLDECIIPCDKVLEDYPNITAKQSANKYIKNGNKINIGMVESAEPIMQDKKYKLYDSDNHFIGLYSFCSSGFLTPEVVLTDLNNIIV